MNDDALYYSARMRASAAGRHVGGAERLVDAAGWVEAMKGLLQRALAYTGASEIVFQWDPVRSIEIEYAPALPIITLPTETAAEARQEAARVLQLVGVKPPAIGRAIHLLDEGPGPGGATMRGGVIMDAVTGERLEPDPCRGVRATRLDFTPACRQELNVWLARQALTSHRIGEALAIATKAAWSGAIAEVGWSDDPEYVAGYVSSRWTGYCRFNRIKTDGIAHGGRVFFLDKCVTAQEFMQKMEEFPLLIDRMAPSNEREEG